MNAPGRAEPETTELSIVGDRVVQLVVCRVCSAGFVRLRRRSLVALGSQPHSAQYDPVRARVVYDRGTVDLVRFGGVIRMDGAAEAPKTTTISTIAVQSGSTRIVIALLQVGIALRIRVMYFCQYLRNIHIYHVPLL